MHLSAARLSAVKRGECPYDNMTHKNHMNTPGKMIVSESSKSRKGLLRVVNLIFPVFLGIIGGA